MNGKSKLDFLKILWYATVYENSNRKEATLGGTRVIILCLELGFIWLVYTVFGLLAAYEPPIWAASALVILVDRAVGTITEQAERRRKRLD